MEFEVSPGFTPHQHAAVKGNQPVRVVRSWEGPTPPVTLPLQPGTQGRKGHCPCHACPSRRGQGGIEEPVVGLGALGALGQLGSPPPSLPQEPSTPAAAQGPPAPVHSHSRQEFCKSHFPHSCCGQAGRDLHQG